MVFVYVGRKQVKVKVFICFRIWIKIWINKLTQSVLLTITKQNLKLNVYSIPLLINKKSKSLLNKNK